MNGKNNKKLWVLEVKESIVSVNDVKKKDSQRIINFLVPFPDENFKMEKCVFMNKSSHFF